MSPDELVYRRLAAKLDSLPHGFPSTSSGVELRILAKIFAPEDAAMAVRLKPVPETAEQVARRLKLPLEATRDHLDRMAVRGQIATFRIKGKVVYCLVPFVVGIYEFQLPHMDAGLAEMFEEYAPELLKAVDGSKPALARVVPVNRRIEARAEVLSYTSLKEMVGTAKSFQLMPCICRKEQGLLGKPCTHTSETCLAFSPEPDAYEGMPPLGRVIDRDAALALLDRVEEEGLVHCTYNLRGNQMFVCNCCSCCCGFLRGVRDFGAPHLLAHSDWVAAIDRESCTECGVCRDERCPMGAIAEDYSVDGERCIGCGVCTTACPTDAARLVERPAAERSAPASNLGSWAISRTVHREGIRGVGRVASMLVDAFRLQRALRRQSEH